LPRPERDGVRRAALWRMARARLALAAMALLPVVSAAEQKPLWEAGLGLAVIDFPDYRGSDERQTFILPLPYLIYRGEILQADRDGARGKFFRSERLELDLSFNGSIPVDSSDNGARSGMPDLDPTLEVGPSLKANLLRDRAREIDVGLTLPVRTVIATDFSHTHNVGWTFEPRVDVDFRDTWLGEGWNVGVGAGPLFGDKRVHNYFFGVPAQFAAPGRPAYVADSGYAGMRALIAVSRRFPSFWFGAFLRADTLAGSVVESSPLVRRRESYAAGFGVTWMLGQSSRMVESEGR
jgi:outer membrane scaffolding protein for murein synthesis (MipA/OmpV family)